MQSVICGINGAVQPLVCNQLKCSIVQDQGAEEYFSENPKDKQNVMSFLVILVKLVLGNFSKWPVQLVEEGTAGKL